MPLLQLSSLSSLAHPAGKGCHVLKGSMKKPRWPGTERGFTNQQGTLITSPNSHKEQNPSKNQVSKLGSFPNWAFEWDCSLRAALLYTSERKVPHYASPGFMTHKSGEITQVYCFIPCILGVICYIAVDNVIDGIMSIRICMLTPSAHGTSECDWIWRKGLQGGSYFRMRPSGWILMQPDWCPCRKRETRDIHTQKRDTGGGGGGMQPSLSHRDRPQRKPNLLTC